MEGTGDRTERVASKDNRSLAIKKKQTDQHRLSDAELLQLKRWNTPTVYDGWEQITRHDPGKDGFNIEEALDFMPHLGPMVGYAVTVVCEPSKAEHRQKNPNAWSEYRRLMAPVTDLISSVPILAQSP